MSQQSHDKIELDPELIKDFLNEFNDAYEELQRTLVLVDQYPGDIAMINQLFRVVHSIKSNLRMMGLDRLSEIVHSLENIIDDIRHQRISYTHGINDILLIATNQVRELALHLFRDEDVYNEVDKLNVVVQVLCMVEPSQLPGAISRVLMQIDPDQQHDLHEPEPISSSPATPALKVVAIATSDASPQDNRSHSDMDYFMELVSQMEHAMPHWAGRNQRILDMCLAMNAAAGNPVDNTQLSAAVCLHDIGMAFIPASILNKSEALTPDEILILRGHCHTGYEWLKRIPGWEQAAAMVHQHHERLDGKGYPQGLSGDAICPGARIIAIADTFDAMTSSRAHREHKRPVMRAVLEINSSAGQQFDAVWVGKFNEAIKSRSRSTTD